MRMSYSANLSCAPEVSDPPGFTNPINHSCLLEKVRWFLIKFFGMTYEFRYSRMY